jgi:hypothetical protein
MDIATHKASGVNNAQLLFIHTHGSPLRNIPPRPVIEPSIEASDNKERIAGYLAKALKARLDGDKTETLRWLHMAGLAAENAAKAWFTDPRNGWAPLDWKTILRKSMRWKGLTKPLRRSLFEAIRAEGSLTLAQYEIFSDAARPLIDTAQMRNAITHIVKEEP